MGLEKVKSRVKTETDRKVREKTASAKAEAAGMIREAQKKADEEARLFKQSLGEEIEQIKKREAASTSLEISKANLGFRKQFTDQVFDSVREKLEKLPEKKRSAHVKTLLKRAGQEIEVAAVLCSRKDLGHVGKKHKKDSADILGGVIAESENGELRVDYSYEALIADLKETLVPEISRMLFEEK